MANTKTIEILNEGLKRQFRIEIPSVDVPKKIDLFVENEKGKKYKEDGFRPGKVPFPRLKEIFPGIVFEGAIKQTIQENVTFFS